MTTDTKFRKLTGKQWLFCQEYIVDLNATQAAIRAGYAPKSAVIRASRLLRQENVQAAIQEAQRLAQVRSQVTVERLVEEYAKIAFADLTDIIRIEGGRVVISDTATLTPAQAAALSEIHQTKDGSIKIKLHSKQAALDSLAKTLGMFRDASVVEDTRPPPIIQVNFEKKELHIHQAGADVEEKGVVIDGG